MDLERDLLYDVLVIEDILPHRGSFLFVDRVTELELDHRIVAEKTLLIDSHFFAGHFPGNPIMPGVLVSEALAQTSGLLLGLTWKKNGSSIQDKKASLLFLANVNIKFSSPAKPGETLRLEANLIKHFGRLYYFEVAAHVGNRQIANGSLALAEKS